MNEQKQCTVCKQVKPLTDFHKRNDTEYQSRCKVCHIEMMKDYRYNAETPAHELRCVKWLESSCLRKMGGFTSQLIRGIR